MTDPLPEIEQRWNRHTYHPPHLNTMRQVIDDVEWLVSEVKRLRATSRWVVVKLEPNAAYVAELQPDGTYLASVNVMPLRTAEAVAASYNQAR